MGSTMTISQLSLPGKKVTGATDAVPTKWELGWVGKAVINRRMTEQYNHKKQNIKTN